MTQPQYFVGLDLGQAQDYTALAVLEQSPEFVYAVRYLYRFPLGQSYPRMVENIRQLLQAPALSGAALVVDQTGVGRAVVDIILGALRGHDRRIIPVTITAGHTGSRGNNGWNVPKKDLVATIQTLLQTRRLQIARSLPEAAMLVKELENFRVKITESAHETFNAREGQHDDLVLAVALAAWLGELWACRPMSDAEFNALLTQLYPLLPASPPERVEPGRPTGWQDDYPNMFRDDD